MHQVTEAYAEKWWTDETVAALSDKTPDGPYMRRVAAGGARIRKDGFTRLPRNGME